MYVALYTGIALGSPTPTVQGSNYYQMTNYSCADLCFTLANDPTHPAQEHAPLRALRLILLIISCLALCKEFFQIVTQKEKYFRRFYINLIELHMYVSISCPSAFGWTHSHARRFVIGQCHHLFHRCERMYTSNRNSLFIAMDDRWNRIVICVDLVVVSRDEWNQVR